MSLTVFFEGVASLNRVSFRPLTANQSKTLFIQLCSPRR